LAYSWQQKRGGARWYPDEKYLKSITGPVLWTPAHEQWKPAIMNEENRPEIEKKVNSESNYKSS